MSSCNLLIIGAGGHARSIYELACGLGYRPLMKEVHPCDLPTLESELAKQLISTPIPAVVGIGNNFQRMAMYQKLVESKHFYLVSLIDRSASVSSFSIIGRGSVVMRGAMIGPGASIGDNVVVNTSSVIEHDCFLGNHASVASGATMSGCSSVGQCSFVGAGSVLSHKIIVGEHVFIGAGSTVIRDLPSFMLAYGSPAKVQRTRLSSENHL